MANLTAAQRVERGKELKPARLLAFKLWKENKQITNAELGQALKEKGFDIINTTRATWLARFKKRPAVKLSPARLLAFKLWQENPLITATELDQALKEKGFELSKSTLFLWLRSFKGSKGVSTYEEKPATAMKPSEITLEQIIKAAGNVEALSLLFYQGVMEELKRRDSAYDVLKQDCLEKDNKISGLKHELNEVTRERNRMMREYNEKLAKVKAGTLTMDKATRRLIPKM